MNLKNATRTGLEPATPCLQLPYVDKTFLSWTEPSFRKQYFFFCVCVCVCGQNLPFVDITFIS